MENTVLNHKVHLTVPHLPTPCPAVKPTAWLAVAPESGDECAAFRNVKKSGRFRPLRFLSVMRSTAHYPRNAFPGVAPVCIPSSTTVTPFTITV